MRIPLQFDFQNFFTTPVQHQHFFSTNQVRNDTKLGTRADSASPRFYIKLGDSGLAECVPQALPHFDPLV